MNRYFLMFLFAASLLFYSCKHEEYTIEAGESQIVVEGWIEEGDVARVLVTRSIPMTDVIDSVNFLKYAIRSATVIVSTENETDTLRLKSATQYLPPFLYIGEKITGRTGEKYKLTVKYPDAVLTAESTIPPSVPLINVQYIHTNPGDTTGNLIVEFTDPAGRQDYYQIATLLEGHDEIFVPCLYGNLSDKNFTSQDIRMHITRGITVFPKTNFESHFNDGDHIQVKLRTMTREGFDFWNLWQNEIVNAQNAIFPANRSLKGNIDGGIGIWCGYGHSSKNIIAR